MSNYKYLSDEVVAKADDLQVQKYIDECQAVKAKYPK
jgi:hypothetical protein